MTQKELLYLEDAIGHEDNIIKIIEESIKLLDDNDLVSFFDEELSIHNALKQNLIEKLEVSAYE